MKILSNLITLFLLITASMAGAQTTEAPKAKTKKLKGTFYFTWGYHRDQYTHSTIHFKDRTTDNYDFTFHHASAVDRPDWSHFFHTALTVPQYVANLGYFFNDRNDLGIEVSWDHLKYIVRDNQRMHLTGMIREQYYDKDTLVTPNFVHYEHTNGNNYLMVSLVKRQTLIASATTKQKLNAIFKVGLGVTDPKTESNIMGGLNDGPFRISGMVFGASVGLRYDLFKYFYLESSVKGAFVDYTDVKLINDGRANQVFGSVQYIMAAGINVPLN
jgi:hypothetical protein